MTEDIKFKESAKKTGSMVTGLYYRHPISSADMNSFQLSLINNAAVANVASNTDVDGDSQGQNTEPYVVMVTDPLRWPQEESPEAGIPVDETTFLFKRRVYSISGAVYNSFTKTYFNINSDNADIQYILPPTDRTKNNKLYLWVRPVTYTCKMTHTTPKYIPEVIEDEFGNKEIIVESNKLPVSGFIKTNSVEGSQLYVDNDIFDDDMDMEVSVRYGIEWALAWEGQDQDLKNWKFQPTETYLAVFIRDIPAQTDKRFIEHPAYTMPARIQKWVYADIVLENPIRWKYQPSYCSSKGRAVLMHLGSQWNVWVVEGLPLNSKESQLISAIDIVFEYPPNKLPLPTRDPETPPNEEGAPAGLDYFITFGNSIFMDGTSGGEVLICIKDLEGHYITADYPIIPNQTITFYKDRNEYTYIDQRTEAYRQVRYRGFKPWSDDNAGHIDYSTANQKKALIKCVFDFKFRKFRIPENTVYNFSGVDHKYFYEKDNQGKDTGNGYWETVMPAGVVISSIAPDSRFEYDESAPNKVKKISDPSYSRIPPGFLPLTTKTVGNRTYVSHNASEKLFEIVGDTYGTKIVDGLLVYGLPDFRGMFIRGVEGVDIRAQSENVGDKVFEKPFEITVNKANLPTDRFPTFPGVSKKSTSTNSANVKLYKQNPNNNPNEELGPVSIAGTLVSSESTNKRHYHYSGVTSAVQKNQPDKNSQKRLSRAITSNLSIKDYARHIQDPNVTKDCWGFPSGSDPAELNLSYWPSDRLSISTEEIPQSSSSIIGNNLDPCLGITSTSIVGLASSGIEVTGDLSKSGTCDLSVIKLHDKSHSHTFSIDSMEIQLNTSQKSIKGNCTPKHKRVHFYVSIGTSLVVNNEPEFPD